MDKQIILTQGAPAPIGPYSQAIMFKGILYASGQIAIDPSTGNLVMDSIEAETKMVMSNVGAILEAAGMTYGNIIKTSIFLSDMAYFGRVNEVYGSYFTNQPPARETVQVAGLPKGVNVEISIVAG
jgi:2-iminobutanoate/2-iminopropanoate deaminase